MSVAVGTRSVRLYAIWPCAAGLIALLLCTLCAAHAADIHPLRPTDTSSPRATLQGFVETTDDIYRRFAAVLEDYSNSDRLFECDEHRKQQRTLREAPKIARYLDVSGIPPVLMETVIPERVLQLKEILDRIDIPEFADIPDADAMTHQTSKRWRLAQHRDRHRPASTTDRAPANIWCPPERSSAFRSSMSASRTCPTSPAPDSNWRRLSLDKRWWVGHDL